MNQEKLEQLEKEISSQHFVFSVFKGYENETVGAIIDAYIKGLNEAGGDIELTEDELNELKKNIVNRKTFEG